MVGDPLGMRRLILFRHGKADVLATVGDDQDRPLAERGRFESEISGRWLADEGFIPDRVLVSPSARTRETWTIAGALLPDCPISVVDDLYLAPWENLQEAIVEAAPGAQTVMVVGHNPGLQELSAEFAASGASEPDPAERIMDGFPTGAVCIFDMSGAVPIIEALYEPPRRVGDAPRSVFRRRGAGDAA